jgi:hypothetical protein
MIRLEESSSSSVSVARDKLPRLLVMPRFFITVTIRPSPPPR